MTFFQDESDLPDNDSRLRPPPLGNFMPGFPNVIPGPKINQPQTPSNLGKPPATTPSKNAPDVQHLVTPSTNIGTSKGTTKAVSPNSIKFCLFQFTYIWETNGNSYWAFPFDIDKNTLTGLRWFRGRWNYFGVDLKRIDSFVCYRDSMPQFGSVPPSFLYASESDNNLSNELDENSQYNNPLIYPNQLENQPFYNKVSNSKFKHCNCSNKKSRDLSPFATKKEYTINGINTIYSRTLASVNTPEIRDAFTEDYIFDDEFNEDSRISFPCKEARITNYRIIFEITYPNKLSEELIETINTVAFDASIRAEEGLNNRINDNLLCSFDEFEKMHQNIPNSLNIFTLEFNNKIRHLKLPKDIFKNINYRLTTEVIQNDWQTI